MREKDYFGEEEEEREVKMSDDGFNIAIGLTEGDLAMDVEKVHAYGTLDVFFEGK